MSNLVRGVVAAAVLSVAAALAVSPSTPTPTNEVVVRVLRVVDGDTIAVENKSRKVSGSVRIIGIDTPETVDPRKPVQCFGPEASAEAHRLLDGKRVTLVYDASQGRVDKYGRILAYVRVSKRSVPEGDYGLHMIREGFAKEYTYSRRYDRQQAYREAQRSSQAELDGLWKAC